MQTLYDKMRQEIAAGNPESALQMAQEGNCEDDATLLYLTGNALMQIGKQKEAMKAYLRSRQLQPDGPAAEAISMLNRIMNFYHKDLYNP